MRVAALSALDVFIDFVNATCNEKNKNPLSQVLPGVSSSLGKIILGDWKCGTQIKTLALQIWTKTVATVMKDSNFPSISDFPPPSLSTPESNSSSHVPNDESLEAFRTFLAGHNVQTNKGSSTNNSNNTKNDKETQWVHNAAAQLHRAISLIFPSSFASNTQGFTGLTYVPPKTPFRLCLVKSAHDLLVLCSRTLSSCSPILLETLLLHSDDEDAEVSKKAKQALSEAFTSTTFGNSSDTWESLLEDNLHRIMKSLPRIITVASGDVNKIVPLRLVAGTIKFFILYLFHGL